MVNLKINHQYQDLYIPGADLSRWIELQKVERDILLLYHQLSDYRSINGSLYFGEVYNLPYWAYLNVENVDESRRLFIAQGCLIMLLAMSWQMLDGAGGHLWPFRDDAKSAVDACSTTNERTLKLLATVKLALQLVAERRDPTPELVEQSEWAYREVVNAYFEEAAHDFDANRGPGAADRTSGS
ncbi:MAG: hypothetical protein AAF495_17895 [Pseudomonadota bacterium]